MDVFCFNIRRLIFSTIDFPSRRCWRGREESILILLIWFVLVDTHPYPAVRMCPDAKTDLDGKDLFNVAQAVHINFLWLLRIFFPSALMNFWLNGQIFYQHFDTCFPVKCNTLSFGTQAARLFIWQKVIRACTHEQTHTNCTTLRYESMWTRQGRVYLLTYWDHESQYSVYIGINILATSVLWLHYVYIFFCSDFFAR